MLIQFDGGEVGSGRIDKTASVVFSMDTVLVELGEPPKVTEELEQQKYHVAMARQ